MHTAIKQRYRLKTQEEFVKEFGPNWRGETWFPWNTEMDPLLGQVLPDEYQELSTAELQEYCEDEEVEMRTANGNSWVFSFDMIIIEKLGIDDLDKDSALTLSQMLKDILNEQE